MSSKIRVLGLSKKKKGRANRTNLADEKKKYSQYKSNRRPPYFLVYSDILKQMTYATNPKNLELHRFFRLLTFPWILPPPRNRQCGFL